MVTTLSKTVLFIPGAFVGSNCWADWKPYFERRGYATLTPAWPHKASAPEALRNNDVYNAIASVRLVELIDHFTRIVQTLPEMPILVGHSVGGLIVQLLLQQGVGAAGVALHSFPPRRVGGFTFPFIKAWWEPMGFFSPVEENYLISFRKWKQVITNGMPCERQKDLYYQYAVPESKRLIRDLFMETARINFNSPHVPLLFISGGEDRLIPSAVNYRNYMKYKTVGSITDYMDFPQHNHLIFGGPEWTIEADYALYWLQRMGQ